jgi:cathepsin A (carboxypeptidase C)
MKNLFAAACISAVAICAPDDENVPYMPGMGNFDTFGLYSGYISLEKERQIHYVFVEAQEDHLNAPVLVWTNGGPGCSSMLGFTQENGPFSIASGTTEFEANPYSWNRETNVLYIEQPAGVGFSYCTDTESCTFDDHSAGKDNLDTILAWYEKYPEYKENELYLSGESYGGIYVPYMAYYID